MNEAARKAELLGRISDAIKSALERPPLTDEEAAQLLAKRYDEELRKHGGHVVSHSIEGDKLTLNVVLPKALAELLQGGDL